jgi:hypothetical protein
VIKNMSGFVKPMMISLFLMCGILMGGFTFIVNGYHAYGTIDNKSDTMLTNTMTTMNKINTTAQVLENKTKGEGALTLGSFTSIGLIFNNLGALGYSFYAMGEVFTSIFADLQENSIIALPQWFIGMIMGIIGVVIVLGIIAYWIGRSHEDM